MYGLVIVHEDGAVCSYAELPYAVARDRFHDASNTESVVYAHYSDANYVRVNSYNRPKD